MAATSSTRWVDNRTVVLAEAPDKLSEAHVLFGIGPSCRLVQEQELRVRHDRLGDAHAPPHAAGKRADLPARHVLEVDGFECFTDPAMPLARFVELFQHCEIVDELEDGEPGIKAEVLGQVAEPSTDLYSFTVMTRAPAVGSRRARGRGEQGREDAKHRRLAGAVGSNRPVIPGPIVASTRSRARTEP